MKKFKTFIQLFSVALIAFFAFFLIYRNIPQGNGIQLYFMDIFNSLMGAVVVALVTASIFIFQRKIESDDEKNRSIYEQKLSLYLELSSKLDSVIQDNKITEKELSELQALVFRVILVAGPSAGKKYFEMLLNIKSGVGNQIDETLMSEILNFVATCRRDLEVLVDLGNEQQKELESFLHQMMNDERMVENISRKKRTFDDKHRKMVLNEFDAAETAEEKEEVLRKYKLYPVQINTFRKTLASRKN